jgi:TonB-linked SusC/RagA family outer membrane protein
MNKQLIKILGVCAMLFFTTVTYAQTRTITGKVVDEKSQPIVGAVVKEKGTSNGAIANPDGSFSLKATTANPILVISFIGMETQEVAVGTSNSVNIKMKSASEEFGEIVVTAQNIKKSARSLGYSIASVKSVDITDGGDRSAVNGLQGKIAGVQISAASSDPGASTRIFIRGIHSLSQGTQPLIVVDGIPISNNSINSAALDGGYDFGNGLNSINPNDIESMEVLKGSAASALYGSRGANGVIMITTKKGSGKAGKKSLGIEYNGVATFSSVLRMPNFQNQFGQGWDGNHWLDENGSWGPEFDGRDRVYGRVVDNSQLLAPYNSLDNNIRDFFDRGVSFQNSIGVSGGNESSSFYASYSKVSQDGIYPGPIDVYDRNTVSLKAQTVIDKLTVSGGVNMALTEGKFVATGQGQQSVYNNMMQLPRNMSVLDMQDYNAKFYNIEDYFTAYGVTNPYYILNENGNNYNGSKIFGNMQATYQLSDNLSAMYRFGYDLNSNIIHNHRAILLPVGVNAGSVDDQGFVSEQTLGNSEFNNDVILNWNKELTPILNLGLIGGVNVNSRSGNSIFASVNGLDIPGYYNLQNSPGQPTISESQTLRRQFNTYAMANLDYKNLAFLNVSVRRDQSSTLPSENNAYWYPSANLSFVFTDAITLPEFVNFGKFRVGYGQTANDAPIYSIDRYYSQTANIMPFRDITYPFGGVNSFSIDRNLSNPELKPEYNNELELGLDLKVLDNRGQLDFTYYDRRTANMILYKSVAPSAGGTSQIFNFADITNKGIELVASYKVFRKDDGLNWDLYANYTRNRNKVTGLEQDFPIGGLSTTAFIARNGQPIGVIEGSVAEVQVDKDGNPVLDANGDPYTVVDANGVPVASTEKGEYGNSQVNYMLGVGSKFRYKSWSLNILFDARQGGLMFSRTADINYFTGNSIKTTYNDRKPFVYPNSVQKIDNGDGTYSYEENSIAVDPAHMDDFHRADAFDRQQVIDKSFVKLRELSISYSFPASMVERLPFNGLSFSLIGRNLFLWTPVDNQFIDPEVTTFGNGISSEFGEFSANPTTRSYGFALRFTL